MITILIGKFNYAKHLDLVVVGPKNETYRKKCENFWSRWDSVNSTIVWLGEVPHFFNAVWWK
jgi:hypothetical protein